MNKTEKLLHMTAYPAQYTDEEMESLLADEDVRDMYELMVMARKGFEQQKAQTLPLTSSTVQSAHTLRRRVAAAVAILFAMAGIAVAAYFMATRNKQQTVPAEQPATTTIIQPTQVEAPATSVPSPQEVIFEDVELQTILQKMGQHYDKKVVFNNDSTRHIRLYIKWNKEETAKETIERLNNFEKVNIKLDGNNIVSE